MPSSPQDKKRAKMLSTAHPARNNIKHTNTSNIRIVRSTWNKHKMKHEAANAQFTNAQNMPNHHPNLLKRQSTSFTVHGDFE